MSESRKPPRKPRAPDRRDTSGTRDASDTVGTVGATKPASVWDTRKPKSAHKPRADKPVSSPATQPSVTKSPVTKPVATQAATPRPMARTNEERSAVPSDGRRELKYYGVAACQALWDRRPHDVVRVYLEEHLIPKFSELLRGVAAKRKAYHIVASDDLERLTDTIHHQGICILARERTPLEFSDLLGLLKEDQGKQLLVYLDGVENPHNFGAIVRTCAHFGVRFILGAEGRLPKFSGAACRVAEGGAEQVALVTLRHPDRQLQQLRDMDFHFVATAVARGVSLYQHPFAARTLLIMGAEQVGVSNALLELTQQVLKIPGSGNVESLNVSVAFGVCAGEYYRQQITTARSSVHKSPRSKSARSGPG